MLPIIEARGRLRQNCLRPSNVMTLTPLRHPTTDRKIAKYLEAYCCSTPISDMVDRRREEGGRARERALFDRSVPEFIDLDDPSIGVGRGKHVGALPLRRS